MNDVNIIMLSQIMSTDLITLRPDDTVDKVDEIFNSNSFHHIPVVDDDGKIAGIVSKSDFLMLSNKFTLFRAETERENNQRFFKSLLVSEIMTKQMATLQPGDSIRKAADFFRENLFHAIPVVGESKNLLGMVTTFDLINYAYSDRPLPLESNL